MTTIKELVSPDVTAIFIKAYAGNLWYTTSKHDFKFPIPYNEMGDGIFKREDKAIVFMKWIRKHLELLKQAKED